MKSAHLVLELLVLGLRPVVVVAVVGDGDGVALEVEAHLLDVACVITVVVVVVVARLWVVRCRWGAKAGRCGRARPT